MRENEKQKFYKSLLDNIHDGIYFVTYDRKITYWNNAAEKITGFAADEVMGKSCMDNILIHIDNDGLKLCTGSCPLTECIERCVPLEKEVFLHHKDGHRVPVVVRVAPVRDENGIVTGAVEIFSDKFSHEDLRKRIKDLELMSMTDKLTSAASRRYIEATLSQHFEEFKRYGWPFGLAFFDIDDFKAVNDKYGHKSGDVVLSMVALTLMLNVRPFDLVGRWGGEEFVVILRNVEIKEAASVTDKLRYLVENSVIFQSFPEGVSVTVSGGVTCCNNDDTVDSLIARADKLMYESKKKGKNRVSYI